MLLESQTIPSISTEFAERLRKRNQSTHQDIWTSLDSVCDPELPGLTIWDLGILQNILWTDDGWVIEITLTYSGCPAVNVIKEDIISALQTAGVTDDINVKIILSPAWSTDFMSPAAHKHLRNINIAPPIDETGTINCPICNSVNTEVISEFGSTACKALYRCKDCLEPFDYFKQF